MRKIFLFGSFLIVMASCGPKLIYPHLEWLVPWYISDYISLDSVQKNMLEKRLMKQLDWHCRTQLTAYAETLRAIGRDFAVGDQPIDATQIRFYYIKLTAHWKDLLRRIGPDITDILLTASDEQIDELFSNLEKQNREFRKEYVDPSDRELDAKRQKRMAGRLKHWIAELTAEQKAAVADWSSQLTPIADLWLQNREAIQEAARELLVQRTRLPGVRASLLELIVNPEAIRSGAYQHKIDLNLDATLHLIGHLNQLLTAEQRRHLLKRIESLAADFDTLSCDPTELPNPRLIQQVPAD